MEHRTGRRGAGRAAVLLVVLLAAAPIFAEGEGGEGQAEPSPTPAPRTTLQGNEGVHMQTMCTNCNSANIDLSGLGGEYLPIDVGGFDVIGGMATIYALNVTPASFIGNIQIDKGPGDFSAPAEAIGGSIHVAPIALAARPHLQALAETGSFDWRNGVASGGFQAGGLSLGALVTRAESDAIDANRDGFAESGELSREFERLDAAYRFESGLELMAGASWIDEDDLLGHGRYSWLDSRRQGRPVYLPESAMVDYSDLRFGADAPLAGGILALRALRSVRDHETQDPPVRLSDPLETTYEIEDTNVSADLRYSRGLGANVVFGAGLSHRSEEADVNNLQAVLKVRLGHTIDSWENTGLDAGVDVDFSRGWHLRAGLRYDELQIEHEEGDPDNRDTAVRVTTTRDWSRVSPRARLVYKPVPAWMFALAAGAGARAARPIFEEVCCGQQYQSNVEVALETSQAVSLESVWQPKPEFRVGAYVHRTMFDDHIVRVVGASAFSMQSYIQGNVPEARFTGVTLTSRIQPSPRFTTDFSYSWLEAKNTSGDPIVVDVFPPGGGGMPREQSIPCDDIPYHARRSATAQGTWNGSLFDFSLQAQFQGPMWIQTWENVFSNALNEEFSETDSFWIVNARMAVHPLRWLTVHVGVDNVGNYVQNDLSDPTNDYNWGPIRGRYFYGGLTFTM
ncbi:MAG: TonB-dependent receptor [Acidobacteria bacterium]|nr:TonB-dependent receptor [Acidobacteriota bacterium]